MRPVDLGWSLQKLVVVLSLRRDRGDRPVSFYTERVTEQLGRSSRTFVLEITSTTV